MKILVIGSGGMLGHLTTLYLSEQGYNVTDISHKRKCRNNTILLDLLEFDKIKKFLEENTFDVIVNCAAILTSQCEVNKKEAIFLNSYFPHFLEDFFIKSSTKVIQVSTAGVYSGTNAPYSENCVQDTQNFYGKSKSLGEIINKKDLTIRSDFIGPDMSVDGKGLFNWIMNAKGSVKGYNKAIFNGVTSLEFAKFLERIMKEPIVGSYNLHTSKKISKSDFLKLVCKIFDKSNIVISDVDTIEIDMSLKTERVDVDYVNSNIEKQLEEIKKWIESHKDLYLHYF